MDFTNFLHCRFNKDFTSLIYPIVSVQRTAGYHTDPLPRELGAVTLRWLSAQIDRGRISNRNRSEGNASSPVSFLE
jgi:hypothetical protein